MAGNLPPADQMSGIDKQHCAIVPESTLLQKIGNLERQEVSHAGHFSDLKSPFTGHRTSSRSMEPLGKGGLCRPGTDTPRNSPSNSILMQLTATRQLLEKNQKWLDTRLHQLGPSKRGFPEQEPHSRPQDAFAKHLDAIDDRFPGDRLVEGAGPSTKAHLKSKPHLVDAATEPADGDTATQIKLAIENEGLRNDLALAIEEKDQKIATIQAVEVKLKELEELVAEFRSKISTLELENSTLSLQMSILRSGIHESPEYAQDQEHKEEDIQHKHIEKVKGAHQSAEMVELCVIEGQPTEQGDDRAGDWYKKQHHSPQRESPANDRKKLRNNCDSQIQKGDENLPTEGPSKDVLSKVESTHVFKQIEESVCIPGEASIQSKSNQDQVLKDEDRNFERLAHESIRSSGLPQHRATTHEDKRTFLASKAEPVRQQDLNTRELITINFKKNEEVQDPLLNPDDFRPQSEESEEEWIKVAPITPAKTEEIEPKALLGYIKKKSPKLSKGESMISDKVESSMGQENSKTGSAKKRKAKKKKKKQEDSIDLRQMSSSLFTSN